MFDLPEEEITWDIVGKWTAEDTDLDYSIVVEHQPMSRMDTMIGSTFSPHGQPYRVSLMYFLKGSQLLIATLRCGKEVKNFESKNLIDLSSCALMTEPVIIRKSPHYFFSCGHRASYWGERFFFHSGSHDLPPCQPAFTLRFPETSSYYRWEEAVKFSSAMKRRIHHTTRCEQDASSNGG